MRRIARVGLTALVVLLAVPTLAGFLDRVSWVFEPATIFRLQYTAVLLAAGVFGLVLRQPYLVVAALGLAAINVVAIAPWQSGARADDSTGGRTLRIVAFNVDSENERYDELGPLVARLHPDVLGLIELTPGWGRAARTASARVKPRRLVVRKGAYGMGLLSAVAPTAIAERRFPADGPVVLTARFSVDHVPVTFALVHVHTPFAGSVHARELRALAAARPSLGRRLVVCGDFNTVSWSSQLSSFRRATHLTDVFRGNWHAYSWPSWGPVLAVPLDHCLISSGLAVRGRRIGPNIGSDHYPLVLDVAVTGVRA